MTQWEVVAHIEDEPHPETFVVDADSAAEAERRVNQREEVTHVFEGETERWSTRFEVEVTGSEADAAAVLDELDALSPHLTGDLSVDRIDGRQWPREIDLDDAEVRTLAVGDWEQVLMRVVGIPDHLGGGDGVDMTADQLATENSTVEFIVGEEVLAKLVLADD